MTDTPPKLPLTSLTPLESRLESLKDLIPEAFVEGKIDFDKLRAALGASITPDIERYGLSWAGKSEALRAVQIPGTGTLTPQPAESVDFENSQNLIIEGDNLEVLKVLQRSYFGKIKMIYIDPPYNTGNDFIYPDNFKEGLQDYLIFSGQRADDGTRQSTKEETGGRFHSRWLNMMYPRLFLARNLLRSDGVIFISIDDSEFKNLKAVMDEIFGEENVVGVFVWKRRSGANDAQDNISIDHEYIIAARRSQEFQFGGVEKGFSNYANPDNDPRGAWVAGDLTCNKTKEQRPNLYFDIIDPKTNRVFECNPRNVWRFEKQKMQMLIINGKVIFPEKMGGGGVNLCIKDTYLKLDLTLNLYQLG